MKTSYCYSDAEKRGLELESRETTHVAEVLKHLQYLTQPKRSLMTTPPGLEGYLDFCVRDDSSIEMEIMERCEDDFATVDIAMAARIMEIAMTDMRSLPLRRKLDGLQIDWIT